MDRTAFAGVSPLHTGETLPRRAGNERVARELVRWLEGRRSAAPFFALLWLDHSDADIGPVAVELPADPRYAANPEAQRRFERYRRGLWLIDGLVAEVLAALDRAGLAEETVVLLMGDHGFEFDDLGLGYYGHASNYSQYQLRTPLMIRWPGRAPRRYTHRSSHLDLPATLMTGLLGCSGDPGNYGMGRNLLAGESWDWIIAGSYHSFAIVEPGRIVVSTPGGFAQVLGPDYREDATLRLDPARIEQAIAEMRRFYR
jgi:membrane-anchored protein YejM (alkaline phosphatase superfamily)